MGIQQSALPPPPTGQAAATVTQTTPPIRDATGHAVSWLGAAAPDPRHPVPISVARATTNYPEDLSEPQLVPFAGGLPSDFVPLFNAAEHVWELLANVEFIAGPDSPTLGLATPDLRVGLVDLTGLKTKSGGPTLSNTASFWDDKAHHFEPDNLVQIQDPKQRPVAALADGDLQYQGTQHTVFREFLHAIGYALGLANNPNDPHSIMNPDVTGLVPDLNDIATVQALYGPSSGRVSLSAADATELNRLLPGLLG